MKNILVLILCFISLNMLGQYSMGPTAKFGVSDMPNDIESIRRSTHYTEYGSSYSIGIINEYELKNWFSVELDVLFEHLRSEQFYFTDKDKPNGYRSTQLNEIGYLSMPLLLKFNYKKFSVHAGAQASYKVTEHLKLVNTNPDNVQTVNEGRNGEAILKWNYALISAISYNIYQNFELELRYAHGLNNIMNEETGLVYYASTQQFLCGLNYKFDFQKKKSIQEVPQK